MKTSLAAHESALAIALPPSPSRTPAVDVANDGEAVEAFIQRGKGTKLRRAQSGRRFVVYIPHDLARRFLVRCAEQDRSLSDGAALAFEAWLVTR